MSHQPPERRTGRSRLTATASLLTLAASVCLAALAGCGTQIAGGAAGQAARGGAGAGAAPHRAGGHGTAAGQGMASAARAARAGGLTTASGTPSGVSGGALFGGNFPVVGQEPNLGRKLAIVRLYYFIGDAFPGKYANLLAGGRTVLVSLDTGGPSYAAVAAGKKDAQIKTFLQSVNQAAVQYHLGSIYVTFQHEPDSLHHRAAGAPVQYIQAWDHVHELASLAHLNWNDGGRLHWVLILIHDTYAKAWRVGSFWPGNSEVDIVAADGYNSYGCGSGGQTQQQTPALTFGPVVNFAASHGGLPVFLAEWGSDDIPAGTQATYINQMQSFVAANTSIAGVMYWDTHVGNCNYKVDGNPSSIAALAAMGQSAALQGHV